MISVVVPFYNERESVHKLHTRLTLALQKIGRPFEFIFVDDGSTDGTFEKMRDLSHVRAFRFGRNLGQTAAFGCGVSNAKGDIIVTIDGDLENDPDDIARLLDMLEEGYDVVAGWRQSRWGGQLLTRRLPSLLANRIISRATGVSLHDHGCSLRAYRRGVFEGVQFNGEMHRMLAAYLGMNGAHIAEVPVSYRPREHGKSKYGLSRTFKVLLDVLAFFFFREYATRPMHFFGYAGFISIGFGFATFFVSLYLRLFQDIHFNRTPLPVLVAIFIVVGFQFILMGLLAEILSRGGGRGRESNIYEVREHIENV